MNSSRIRLSRIIAFNWYGFRTIIEVNGLTLLCGETGTGKSALLDLIQFVMSAGSAKFNKAAAGESNARDLRGYCLCDTNTRQRDGQPRFLRRSGATVAALEFSWPAVSGEEPRRETWGMRVQYESPSAQPSYVRFFVPGGWSALICAMKVVPC
ncbi:MAG: ATP-binding protein [Luteolibacter sp.]